jgi:hypothetical protein
MAVLSSDDCQMILDVLNNKISFTGEVAMRTWLPIIDKLHDGIEGDLPMASTKEIQSQTIIANKIP